MTAKVWAVWAAAADILLKLFLVKLRKGFLKLDRLRLERLERLARL
jgi:hypothetical protein